MIETPRGSEGDRYHDVYLDGDRVGTVFKSYAIWEPDEDGCWRPTGAQRATARWLTVGSDDYPSCETRALAAYCCAAETIPSEPAEVVWGKITAAPGA